MNFFCCSNGFHCCLASLNVISPRTCILRVALKFYSGFVRVEIQMAEVMRQAILGILGQSISFAIRGTNIHLSRCAYEYHSHRFVQCHCALLHKSESHQIVSIQQHCNFQQIAMRLPNISMLILEVEAQLRLVVLTKAATGVRRGCQNSKEHRVDAIPGDTKMTSHYMPSYPIA